jgi:hypothetical protein
MNELTQRVQNAGCDEYYGYRKVIYLTIYALIF